MAIVDPALLRLRDALSATYGDRIERIVLFGSRARGDAAPDSDFDVALFLHDLRNRWPVLRELVDIERAIRDDTGADIHSMPFPAGAWEHLTSPLMDEIRREGIDL
jgi:uncharacterized protein